jgi:hypothetical protein
MENLISGVKGTLWFLRLGLRGENTHLMRHHALVLSDRKPLTDRFDLLFRSVQKHDSWSRAVEYPNCTAPIFHIATNVRQFGCHQAIDLYSDLV